MSVTDTAGRNREGGTGKTRTRFTSGVGADGTITLPSPLDNWEAGLIIPKFRAGRKFTEHTRAGTPVRITAGLIDRDASRIFVRGQCMALAAALASAGVGTPVAAMNPGTDSLAHALVRLPDGQLLDIGGVHSAAEISKTYDLVDYDTQEFADHVENASGFALWSDPANLDMAQTFVGVLAGVARTHLRGAQLPADGLTTPDELADHTDIDRYFAGGVDSITAAPWARQNIYPTYYDGHWRAMPAVDVDPSGLYRTQKRLFKKHLMRALAGDEPDGGDIPWIVRFEGKAYVIDGHHRVAHAVHNGHQTVAAHVVDLGH